MTGYEVRGIGRWDGTYPDFESARRAIFAYLIRSAEACIERDDLGTAQGLLIKARGVLAWRPATERLNGYQRHVVGNGADIRIAEVRHAARAS